MFTCSGKKAVITPGEVVHFLDGREFRVLRTNIHSGTVVLQRKDADANQRSFMRHSTAICSLPTPTRDAEVSVNEPNGNCFSKIPVPPVLPEAADASTSCNLEVDKYVTYKHSEFYSVVRLQQGFEQAKTATSADFKDFCKELLKSNTLKEKFNDLKQRIATLTCENESLLKRTFELTEYVSSVTAITSAHHHPPVFQRMLYYNIQQLPRMIDANTAPHHLLFRVLGCAHFFPRKLYMKKYAVYYNISILTRTLLYHRQLVNTYHW